jgi:peptide/nickel transport system ATP-binding protein
MPVQSASKQGLLEVNDLTVEYALPDRPLTAIKNASFRLDQGLSLGIVGESGSGKSTLARAIFGALASNGRITRGSVLFRGQEITAPSPALEKLRWKSLSFVPQSAIASLDPLFRVGRQIVEIYEHHQRLSRKVAREKVLEIFAAIDLQASTFGMYPHELSGGMRQRVVIAAALALRPQIVIADEPTTSLDTLVQRQVFQRFDAVRREIGTSLILVTHDLGLVADYCDDIIVMYRGEVVESGAADNVLFHPQHPYTRELLRATDRLSPAMRQRDSAPAGVATRTAAAPLIEFDRVVRVFRRGLSYLRRGEQMLRAVDQVSFAVREGEVLGIIGASGSGKSTIANMAIGLDHPTSGEIRRNGKPVGRYSHGADVMDAQLIFQDPYQSMNPIFRVEWIVAEAIRAVRRQPRLSPTEIRCRVVAALEAAGLHPAKGYLASRLHQLSGGERQRVAIARAIVTDPRLIIADEPVSMLDVSVRAGVLETLRALTSRSNRGMIYITHDLGTVGFVCDRLLVLREGRNVEVGPCQQVLAAPRVQYTRDLLQAMPGNKLRRLGDDTTVI